MLEKCHSCGAETPPSLTGVTHSYLNASPGCWAQYGEVLAREYSDAQYFAVHSITVDAYSVQHPGHPTPQEISSLNLHLASLYAHYRNQVELYKLSHLKSHLAKRKDQFQWLSLPSDLGRMTINDIWQAETAEQHCERVLQWGEIVLDCWRDYHSYIRDLCV
ncbi:MAG: DUF5946 family protein [Cyanobacteria bacterium P01_C01_bin.120]